MPEKSWLCPLCGLEKLPYGSTCPKFADRTCEHIHDLHLTGQFYLKEQQAGEGLGISRISDEE